MKRNLGAYHATDTLPDGQVIHLRAIRPDDRERLREEFLKLSKASVRDRFFSIKLDLTPKELTYFTEVDFNHHVALVVELEADSHRLPVAVGRLVRNTDQPDHSEIAITVTDEMQGKGIGKIVLRRLLDCARELGIHHVDATVLANNTRMLALIRKSGLRFESYLEDGIRNISVAL